jgi:nicotinamide-nucleotide amidase
MRIDVDLYDLALALGHALEARHQMVATAESCTGGLVGGAITAVAGSSAWFDRGFITYSNEAKIEQLGVSSVTLATFGAVSTQTATEMANGALRVSRAQWALSVTGIAGPAGGTVQKPVGLVCFGWAGWGNVTAEQVVLPGDRASIRRESVRIALQGLIERLA